MGLAENLKKGKNFVSCKYKISFDIDAKGNTSSSNKYSCDDMGSKGGYSKCTKNGDGFQSGSYYHFFVADNEDSDTYQNLKPYASRIVANIDSGFFNVELKASNYSNSFMAVVDGWGGHCVKDPDENDEKQDVISYAPWTSKNEKTWTLPKGTYLKIQQAY